MRAPPCSFTVASVRSGSTGAPDGVGVATAAGCAFGSGDCWARTDPEAMASDTTLAHIELLFREPPPRQREVNWCPGPVPLGRHSAVVRAWSRRPRLRRGQSLNPKPQGHG